MQRVGQEGSSRCLAGKASSEREGGSIATQVRRTPGEKLTQTHALFTLPCTVRSVVLCATPSRRAILKKAPTRVPDGFDFSAIRPIGVCDANLSFVGAFAIPFPEPNIVQHYGEQPLPRRFLQDNKRQVLGLQTFFLIPEFSSTS